MLPFVRGGRALSPRPLCSHLLLLSSLSREAEEGREAGCERGGAEREQVVVEIVALGNEHMGGDARPGAAPGEAFRRPLAVGVLFFGLAG